MVGRLSEGAAEKASFMPHPAELPFIDDDLVGPLYHFATPRYWGYRTL